ncbi:MAG TPA: hypothetical protein VFH88_06155 [Candidatus Krumholzibacteria bacterium]|nr:hypothetical protein [Candidatus Krumholzibacteria bacterium]
MIFRYSVQLLTLISLLYGQARGYRRFGIRRRVMGNTRLSAELLARNADEAFQQHVHRSIKRYPFYAARVKAYRGSLPRPGARVRPEELPVWTRLDQREFFARQRRPVDASYRRDTSGSTGTRVKFYVTRESYEWRTAVADRAYSWAGAQEGVRSVHVWGTGPAQPLGQHIKRLVHVALQRRHYFDAFQHFSNEERAACCAFINRVRPRAIVGYTGMLVDVARYARDHEGALTWKAARLVTAAEGLQPGQRELIESTLAEELFDSYGSREFMNIGMECTLHDGYHLNIDNLLVEVVDGGGMPVPAGAEGHVVVTDFHNAAAPFVRYDIGDIGVMAPDEPCPCGCPFPRLARVDGRLQDVIHTPQGPVTAIVVSDVLRGFDWVEGSQVVQCAIDGIVVRLLTSVPLTAERLRPITAKFRRRLGDMKVEFERVDVLTRRPNGKNQLVISRLDQDTGQPFSGC